MKDTDEIQQSLVLLFTPVLYVPLHVKMSLGRGLWERQQDQSSSLTVSFLIKFQISDSFRQNIKNLLCSNSSATGTPTLSCCADKYQRTLFMLQCCVCSSCPATKTEPLNSMQIIIVINILLILLLCLKTYSGCLPGDCRLCSLWVFFR